MFFGSIVAVVTPFVQGQVDVEAFKKLVQFHANEGSHGLVVGGSTGEGSMLTLDERHFLLQTALQGAGSIFPIIAGCSSGSTHECLVLIEQAQHLGCTAALVTAPFYVKPKVDGILEHFKRITEITHLPLILYNNPGRIGVDMPIDLVLELATLPHVIGIKDSHPDITRLAFIRQGIDDLKQQGRIPKTKPFSVLAGDSSSFAPALALGAHGCISVTANVLPGHSAKLYDAWVNEDRVRFSELRDALLRMDTALSHEVNPVPVKYAVSRLGFCYNEVRLPLTPMSAVHYPEVDAALKTLTIDIV
ncbi:MAG: 4-hydroxy-tetrahydrodipicolinate synthase [Alphaproteobacteria bacterium]|nr:4-hydroxy-tetrahydrodipicolinate synthase [Alphaproteobacteria bacterium]